MIYLIVLIILMGISSFIGFMCGFGEGYDAIENEYRQRKQRNK